MESVILETPLLLVGYGIAFALCVFGIFKRAGYAVHIVSAAIFIAAFTFTLLLGAGMQEALIVTLIFLSLNMTGYVRGGNK